MTYISRWLARGRLSLPIAHFLPNERSVKALEVIRKCQPWLDTQVNGPLPPTNAGFALRFLGNGVDDIDWVKIRLDDPATTDPCPPADIGAEDATLEFWMRAVATENTAGALLCGSGWINGNIIIDHDRFNQDREFGISLAGGAVAFETGRDGPDKHTICGTSNVLDGSWHHIAVQRNGVRNFGGVPAGPE